VKRSTLDLQAQTLSLDISGLLSARDQNTLMHLSETEKTQYLLSKLGLRLSNDDARHSVRSRRKTLAEVESSDKPLVREEKNHFVNLLRRRFSVGSNTTPRDASQYYGIEIECFIPFKSMDLSKYDFESRGTCECSDCEGSGQLTFRHRDSGHEIESECPSCNGSGEIESDDDSGNDDQAIEAASEFFNRKVKELQIRGLDVKHDGSLDADGNDDVLPLELTLLVKQDDLRDLEKLCKLLNDLGAYVNASCGLHVHIDSRNKTPAQIRTIAKRFKAVMPFLGDMVPKSRRTNSYCKLDVSTFKGQRYFAVNLTSFEKHKTIEIRLHSATTSFVKIKNWLRVVSAVYATKRTESIDSWQAFFEYIKADADLIQYINQRVATFGGSTEEAQTSNEPNGEAA